VTRLGCLLALVFVGACDSPPELPAHKLSSPPPGPSPVERAAIHDAAEQVFATRCTPCHGKNGFGDGEAAAALNPHPRNFHDLNWQASVDDAHIEKIIQYGGPSVGRSSVMPANPDLVGKTVINALREKIRHFGS
jgi:mono/diheme cytochrome c family protein